MAWEYYDLDGAFFRKRQGSAGFSVDDVWTGTAWKPYKGDRLKPYCFGSRISAADLPSGAAGD